MERLGRDRSEITVRFYAAPGAPPEQEFWDRVENGIPPEPNWQSDATTKLFKELYPGTDGSVILLPEIAQDVHQALQEAKLKVKEAEALVTEGKNKLAFLLGSAAAGVLPDGTVYTRKKQERKSYTVKATEFIVTRHTDKQPEIVVNAIRSGTAEIALVVGFDKHPRGAFDPRPEDWGLPAGYGEAGLMVTTQFFAIKIARYMRQYGISERTLAKVAAKAFRNGAISPNAWRREALTEEAVAAAPMVNDPLTQYMFCSPGEGGAAIIVASQAAVERLGARQVRLLSVATRTRSFGSFEVFAPSIQGSGTPTSVSADAARAAFEAAGVSPVDIDVAQLQDTEAGAEIMHLAECGFCEHGEQEEWIASGVTEIGGRLPVNTDGGCIANGEPIGASGLRQVHEVVTQLRGQAGERQVPGSPRLGFTHVYGAPGVSACTVLEAVR